MFKYLALGQLAIIATLLGVGYLYYNHTQSIISKLQTDNASLTSAVTTQKTTIESLKNNFEKQNEEIQRLQVQIRNSESRRRDLEKRLRDANLEAAARDNSKKIEQIINDATAREFKNIEVLTSPKNKVEPSITPPDKNTDKNVQPPPSPPKTWPKVTQ